MGMGVDLLLAWALSTSRLAGMASRLAREGRVGLQERGQQACKGDGQRPGVGGGDWLLRWRAGAWRRAREQRSREKRIGAIGEIAGAVGSQF
ncbi:hypothetical protein C2845_PM09G19190 [Panicum miliaceum]|uniref:Uncharacterized protein n=1 Tax=Panicum miliaceum TaxID=4540 RepID=A0A3L6RXE6_PANMI|nr:hypothetical protein C2845_PM09G19190 [Panicum miliaceum]